MDQLVLGGDCIDSERAEEEEQEVYGREGQMDERRKRKDRA